MIFRESKVNDAEAIEYLSNLNRKHIDNLVNKLDSIFCKGIKTVDDVYTANTLLAEYKAITGKEYEYKKEDSIV